jgi:DNA integrity scanning protein DisA with diadenylate cyclase activity
MDSFQIEAVLNSCLDYLSTALHAMNPNLLQGDQGELKGSYSLMRIADAFLIGLKATVTLEYLYRMLNFQEIQWGNGVSSQQNENKYNLTLLQEAYNFALELAYRKIENSHIETGFIFHQSLDQINCNSIESIELIPPIPFGDFRKIKKVLPVTNGRDIFLNVTDSKVTHLLLTKRPVAEISLDNISDGKTFQMAPLILSIQSSGRIVFLIGDTKKNRTILQVINGKPQFFDYHSVKTRISQLLLSVLNDNSQCSFLSGWLVSRISRRKGTTIVIGNFSIEKLKDELVSFGEVKGSKSLLKDSDPNRKLLNAFTRPDGALIFNLAGELLFFGAILPFRKGTKEHLGGGARHHSALIFTETHKCTAIAISEDGAITIFQNGQIALTSENDV